MNLNKAREFASRQQQLERDIAAYQPKVEDNEIDPVTRFFNIIGAMSLMPFMDGQKNEHGLWMSTRSVFASAPPEGSSPSLTVEVMAIDSIHPRLFNPDVADFLTATWGTPSGNMPTETVSRLDLTKNSPDALLCLDRIEESFDEVGTLQLQSSMASRKLL